MPAELPNSPRQETQIDHECADKSLPEVSSLAGWLGQQCIELCNVILYSWSIAGPLLAHCWSIAGPLTSNSLPIAGVCVAFTYPCTTTYMFGASFEKCVVLGIVDMDLLCTPSDSCSCTVYYVLYMCVWQIMRVHIIDGNFHK